MYLVDLVGIEPTTSSMPWKRAPICATGPLLGGESRDSILGDPHSFVKPLQRSSHSGTSNQFAAIPQNRKTRKIMSKWTATAVAITMLAFPAFAQQYAQAAPVPDVQSLVSRIDQTSQAASLDIARLRIDNWMVVRDTKQQA